MSEAKKFLAIADQFKLGHLSTETPHPLSQNLSEFCKKDLFKAIDIFKEIDLNIFETLLSQKDKLQSLAVDIEKTISNGNKIILVGCGATGRLSLALETYWKQNAADNLCEQVVSFMAGGDVALIHSIEDFEDHEEFGAYQLMELNPMIGDLVIGSTEGGETTFVINAVEKALEVCQKSPYLSYCNPDHQLIDRIERSHRVINNQEIKKINLFTGEMALSGSTRLQAASIQMLAIGLCFAQMIEEIDLEEELNLIKGLFQQLDLHSFAPFIEKEAELYQNNKTIGYRTDTGLGIHLLTDTTERSPTFSLNPFDSILNEEKKSWCHLQLKGFFDIKDAWHALLSRSPRCLDWKNYEQRVSLNRLYEFSLIERDHEHLFEIYLENKEVHFKLEDLELKYSLNGLSQISLYLVFKLIMNMHSTLLMGRMGRYESNLMTYVRPSNLKLIDRAIRYAQLLLLQYQIKVDYEDLVYDYFELEKQGIDWNQRPLVMALVQKYLNKV